GAVLVRSGIVGVKDPGVECLEPRGDAAHELEAAQTVTADHLDRHAESADAVCDRTTLVQSEHDRAEPTAVDVLDQREDHHLLPAHAERRDQVYNGGRIR